MNTTIQQIGNGYLIYNDKEIKLLFKDSIVTFCEDRLTVQEKGVVVWEKE